MSIKYWITASYAMNGSAKIVSYLGAWISFCFKFPHFLSYLGEIRYQTSEYNAVEQFLNFVKIGRWKAVRFLWVYRELHLQVWHSEREGPLGKACATLRSASFAILVFLLLRENLYICSSLYSNDLSNVKAEYVTLPIVFSRDRFQISVWKLTKLGLTKP